MSVLQCVTVCEKQVEPEQALRVFFTSLSRALRINTPYLAQLTRRFAEKTRPTLLLTRRFAQKRSPPCSADRRFLEKTQHQVWQNASRTPPQQVQSQFELRCKYYIMPQVMNTERKDSSNSNARTGGPADEVASACACLSNGGMLSIIMPVFNLGKTIYDNIKRVQSIFNDVIPFEIVPVDDGSKDDTRSEIERSANDYPNTVKPVFSPVNGGKGSALAQGLSKTSGTHILLLDGDLDLNPSLVWNFFDIMRNENADIVIGSKMHPESKIDYSLRRRIASFVYYGIVKILIGLPVHDTQTGMKLFTRESLEYAFSRMLVKRFAFDLEVLSIACSNGYKIAEAPVELDFGNKSGSLTLANIRQVMTTLWRFYRLKIWIL